MSARIPSEEEFKGWNAQPMTDSLRAFASAKVFAIKDSWANGLYSHSDMAVMGCKQAEALGYLRAYAELAELTYEDLVGELADGPLPQLVEGKKDE